MTGHSGTYDVELGFLPDAFAIPDVEHPGLLRVGERGAAPYGGESVEHHDCPATDCSHVDVDVDMTAVGRRAVVVLHALAAIRGGSPFAHPQQAGMLDIRNRKGIR